MRLSSAQALFKPKTLLPVSGLGCLFVCLFLTGTANFTNENTEAGQ